MLATPAHPSGCLPADGATWAYEVKWDGMRALVDVARGGGGTGSGGAASGRAGSGGAGSGGAGSGGAGVRVTTRTGRVVSEAFPELAGVLGDAASRDVLLDGELVVLRGGVPSFAALAERFGVVDARRAHALAALAPVRFIVFDVLRCDGHDLTGRPWHERRALLEELTAGARWYLSPVFDDGESLLAATLEQGLEGVMAKRRASRYVPGGRSPDWIKVPHRRTTTCLVGGWRPETDGTRLGSLLLGVREADAAGREVLRYCGKVGSGLAGAASGQMGALLRGLGTSSSPFDTEVRRVDAAGVHWVLPRVAVEIRFKGATDGGRLREPVFLGVRHDVGE